MSDKANLLDITASNIVRRFARYLLAKNAASIYASDMRTSRISHETIPDTLPKIPSWVTSARSKTIEDVAFLSGAALAMLHLVGGREDVPHALLRDRLALRAAEACVAFAGRLETAGELRDTRHLLRAGDLPGPAGETYLSWCRAVERPVSAKALQRALLNVDVAEISRWFETERGSAVTTASQVLETILIEAPRAEVAALVTADATLATALNWKYMVPLLAAGLKRGDLRKRGDALRLACHHAVIASAGEAVRLASDLARKSARLKTITPKLRAKGAGEAVEMFLTRDAVAPSALPLPDRAARRLCDRLVDLGVVRELTGRDTFRLYGV